MTDRPEGDDAQQPRNHRRAAARIRAQRARVQQKRRARRTRAGLQIGIAAVGVAIVVTVVLVIVNSIQPVGPGPKNMASDGIVIGKGLTATNTGALAPSQRPSSSATNSADVVRIRMYVDYLSAPSGQFERRNGAYIQGLVNSGAATVEIHPVAVLTNRSQGSKYSLRAANAAACVANSSPDQFFAVNRALFANQPKEDTAGLSDAQLISRISAVRGLAHRAQITRCITDQHFDSWVAAATTRVTDDGIPDADVKQFTSAPAILVNGTRYVYSTPFTNDEFRNFVVTAAGSSFASDPTETATPTPTPSAG